MPTCLSVTFITMLMQWPRASIETAPFIPFGVHTLEDAIIWFQRQLFSQASTTIGHCPSRQAGHLYGEASPNYSVYPKAPERAHALFPNTKIIFLLRDPIERVISAFNMKWQIWQCNDAAWRTPACFQTLNDTAESLAVNWVKEFEIYVNKEMGVIEKCMQRHTVWTFKSLQECYEMDIMSAVDRYWLLENSFHVGRSLYVDQIENWLQWFPADQILVLPSQEFSTDPVPSLRRLFNFLGVTPEKFNTGPLTYKHHVRQYAVNSASETVLKRLRQVTERLGDLFRPFNARLYSLLNRIGQEDVSRQLRETFEYYADRTRK